MRKLVWVDKKINNEENLQYQTELKQIINECSFFDSIHDALQIVPNQQEGDKAVVIISSSLINECLVKPLSNNQIVFCWSVRDNFSMFLKKYQLLIMIDSGIQKVKEYVKKNLDFLKAQQSLTLQFIQQSCEQTQYNHQFKEVSFRFLMINQKLQEKYTDEEYLLNSEMEQLVSKQVFKKFQEKEKEKSKGKQFTNFEKLIYYYTIEDQFYRILNQKLAQSNYEGLEQIMCTLFYGYSSNLKCQNLPENALYRGINFGDKEKTKFDQLLEEFTECKKNGKSIFWSSLTSTSTKKSTTRAFLNNKYKIFFEISLDQKKPHPYFKLENYHSDFSDEQEVILFPQFEFQVQQIELDPINSQYQIKIKQVQNDFSMALDVTKRKEYWEKRINEDLKPKLREIASFYQIRIDFIMENIRKKQFSYSSRKIKDALKKNSDNYFSNLVTQLQNYCDNQEHKKYLSQLLSVITEEISFETEITDEFLQESKNLFKSSSERLIQEFIEIIKKIYNLVEFKNHIKQIVQERIEIAEEQRKKNERKEDLYEILVLSKEFDENFFDKLIKMMKKGNVTNCVDFLSENIKDEHLEQYFSLRLITTILKCMRDIEFNKRNYSTRTSKEMRKVLITKISNNNQIIELLKFIVRLTALDDQFIQCGSNSLNLLVEMKVNLGEQSFENIKIQETSLIGANFVRCNLSGSKFNNVDISGMNLNGAQLFNCKWNNLKIHEINELMYHTSFILSICFSSDNAILAFGSYDRSIRLWDIRTGQQRLKLDGHTSAVYSVSFSCDGTIKKIYLQLTLLILGWKYFFINLNKILKCKL